MCWIGTYGEGVPVRGSFKYMASVVAGGDDTGTCSASFLYNTKKSCFLFPFLVLA